MNIAEAPKTAPPSLTTPVKIRYQPQDAPTDGDGQNLGRVRLLIRLFGLTVSEVAKAGGASRPYLSRALGGSLVPQPYILAETGGKPISPPAGFVHNNANLSAALRASVPPREPPPPRHSSF